MIYTKRVKYKYRLAHKESIVVCSKKYPEITKQLARSCDGIGELCGGFIALRFSSTSEFLHIEIAEGYAWNGANFAIDTKTWMVPSLFHDALYQLIQEGLLVGSAARKESDLIMRKLLVKTRMFPLRREVSYRLVRAFGWYAVRSPYLEV